jgi:hypothetical protein
MPWVIANGEIGNYFDLNSAGNCKVMSRFAIRLEQLLGELSELGPVHRNRGCVKWWR